MTKPWELHEATIKKLYSEKTLSDVRKIMIEKYNFKASTRAYRGRLDKWGVRKYNCRRRSDGGSVSAGSPEGSISGSDIASPTLSQPHVEKHRDSSSYPTGQQTRDSEPGMPNLLGRPYSTMDMDTHRTDTEHYSRNRTLISPTQDIPYGWNLSPTQPTSPPTIYGHADIPSGPLYNYPPLSPTSNTYPSGIYETDQTARDRRESFPAMPTRQYSIMHNGAAYPPTRDYGHGHGHSIAGIESFDMICDQSSKHNPKS
ncbi:hypothetical protein F4803DRAFT_105238 [Xylaria telfairii]|nr:hypothetical protein F4803DRAFT_105238 [Xylaria telfairii]